MAPFKRETQWFNFSSSEVGWSSLTLKEQKGKAEMKPLTAVHECGPLLDAEDSFHPWSRAPWQNLKAPLTGWGDCPGNAGEWSSGSSPLAYNAHLFLRYLSGLRVKRMKGNNYIAQEEKRQCVEQSSGYIPSGLIFLQASHLCSTCVKLVPISGLHFVLVQGLLLHTHLCFFLLHCRDYQNQMRQWWKDCTWKSSCMRRVFYKQNTRIWKKLQ